MTDKSLFSRVDQVGWVVKDLDKAIRYYESLGIGPFQTHKPNYISRVLWGKPVPTDSVLTRVALAQIGEIQFELIQPIAEGTHWMEFLKSRGEGINHLRFSVDDIGEAEARAIEKGYRIVYRTRTRRPDGSLGGVVYVDTGEAGGLLFEFSGKATTA